MDNISFHGTSEQFAKEMLGPPSNIDLKKGKGELGKGFYTGSSIALAAIWAQLRYQEKAVVIEFNIPRPNFVKLKGYQFKTQAEVKQLWKNLKDLNKLSKYKINDNYDYIIAPFATVEHTGYQFKFESLKAETELNICDKNVYPCGS